MSLYLKGPIISIRQSIKVLSNCTQWSMYTILNPFLDNINQGHLRWTLGQIYVALQTKIIIELNITVTMNGVFLCSELFMQVQIFYYNCNSEVIYEMFHILNCGFETVTSFCPIDRYLCHCPVLI